MVTALPPLPGHRCHCCTDSNTTAQHRPERREKEILELASVRLGISHIRKSARSARPPQWPCKRWSEGAPCRARGANPPVRCPELAMELSVVFPLIEQFEENLALFERSPFRPTDPSTRRPFLGSTQSRSTQPSLRTPSRRHSTTIQLRAGSRRPRQLAWPRRSRPPSRPPAQQQAHVGTARQQKMADPPSRRAPISAGLASSRTRASVSAGTTNVHTTLPLLQLVKELILQLPGKA
ncbi:unnamed protein product, partial [Phaeothamnion confervicola]